MSIGACVGRGGGGRQAGQNFGGLVLGCIEAKFCNQILIFQRFLRSTRFSILCTASNSIFFGFLQNFAKIDDFSRFCKILLEIGQNIIFFIEIFTEFCRNCRNLLKINQKLLKFYKFPEFSRCKGQAGSKMKMTPPPLRVRQTLQKHLCDVWQHSSQRSTEIRNWNSTDMNYVHDPWNTSVTNP